MSVDIPHLSAAVCSRVTKSAIERTTADIPDCPGEVLFMATAFRELAEGTLEHAWELCKDKNRSLATEQARDLAVHYFACYRAIVNEYGGRVKPLFDDAFFSRNAGVQSVKIVTSPERAGIGKIETSRVGRPSP